jgi:excisionase family DNA binding protein
MLDKLYTVKELAEMMKMSPRTIYKLVNQREVTHLRIKRQIRFTKEHVEDLKARTAMPKQQLAEDLP